MVLQILSLVPKLAEKEVYLLWEVTPLVVFTFKKVWILVSYHDSIFKMLLFSLHFLGYALSLLAGNATMISEDFNMTEVFTVLTEVIRDNFRNAKLKQHLLPALGEFLFYAATQEENLGDSIPQWDVPGEAKQIYIIL